MHPGPGAAITPYSADSMATTTTAADDDDDIDEGAGAKQVSATASNNTDDNCTDDRRQTRRRWRLLQYILGWLESTVLGGGGATGTVAAAADVEETLAAACRALVAVTCPGTPAAADVTGIGGAFGGGGSGYDGDRGSISVGASNHRRRPFLIETGGPPCPFSYLDAGAADCKCAGGSDGGGGIADGVWGGTLDNLGPFLRPSGGGRPSRKGRAAKTAQSLWGRQSGNWAQHGNVVDLPTFVDFMAPTLKDCGEL